MTRKAKTPLLTFLQKACAAAIIGETRQMTSDEMDARCAREREPRDAAPGSTSRRDFLKSSVGAAAVGALWLGGRGEVVASPVLPRIAIVGAGIAGLNAAYQLKKSGLRASVYEASSSNSWGRIQTRVGANGLTAELGGEFIDSGHADMLQLAREFRLPLVDLLADSRRARLVKDSYFFGGKHYTERDIIDLFRPVAIRIKEDGESLPEAVTYDAADLTEPVKQLDRTSIEEYLGSRLGLRHSDVLYQLLDAAYTSEFGLEIGDQSVLNFLTMISTDVSRSFEVFGESDERYRIRGGNNRLIEGLIHRLDGQIERDRKLEAVRESGGKFSLHFATGAEIKAEVVILALPFSTLRDVDLPKSSFPAKKREVIKNLGYGTNAKLVLDVSERVWRKQGRAGYLFNERVQNGWDNTQGQKGNLGAGGYTVYLGGKAGRELRQDQTATYLSSLDDAFGGFKKVCNNSEAANWTNNPYSKGSYAAYRPGQWTELAGAEFEPVGNIYFCGEHCSADFQGFMNGGAETGARVAKTLAQKLIGRGRRRASRR